MKEESKEKTGTGNLKVKKKACPAIEKQTHKILPSSKTEVKPSKTKSSYSQPQPLKVKAAKPKSRSASLLEKCDRHLKKNENVREKKLNQDKKLGLRKFEATKKHKSLDHVEYPSLKVIPGVSVAKKVSNVLQQRNSSMLFRFNSNQAFLPRILQSYPSKLNFLTSRSPRKTQGSAEKLGAEKSEDFSDIRIFNKTKLASKCVSAENNKNFTNEKPGGIFNVHNRSCRRISDSFVKKVKSTDPLWDRIQFLNGQNVANINNESEVLNNSGQAPRVRHQEFKFDENKNIRNEKISFSSFTSNSEPSHHFLDLKNPNEHSRQDLSPDKKTTKICQCLHFHTEDGFRQFSLQNHSTEQEVGQKLFRVNYVLKKENEEDEETDSKEKTESTIVSNHSLRSKINQKHYLPKKIPAEQKNNSRTSEKKNGRKTENGPKFPRDLSGVGYSKVSSLSQRDKTERRISETNKLSNGKSEIFPLVLSETEIKNQAEEDKRKKIPRHSEEVPLETDYKKAKEELQILGKLFSKLNLMDSSSFKEVAVDRKKKQPIDETTPRTVCMKWKGSQALAEKACQMLQEIEAEERYLKEKNKLRQKIIKHVQNFIKLEFNEN